MKKVTRRLIAQILTLAMVLLSVVFILPEKAAAEGDLSVKGYAHIQNVGDSNGSYQTIDGRKTLVLGSRGKSQRLEAMSLTLDNTTGIAGSIEYRVHIQNIGWTGWLSSGSFAGTRGMSYRLEGIQIRLTGDLAMAYDVRYRTHIQNIGDGQGWVYNGMMAGTEGLSYRLEELQIQFIKKTESNLAASVAYKTHVQNVGWENVWRRDGQVAGTMGRSLRLEGIYITLAQQPYTGGIVYRTHVQNIGWQDWRNNGEMSGTSGKSYRLEAIQIYLTGEMAKHYDVYYRVHAQNYGWLGWASNGDPAGTAGKALRLEGIQIVLKTKGSAAPTAVGDIVSKYNQAFAFTNVSQIPANPVQIYPTNPSEETLPTPSHTHTGTLVSSVDHPATYTTTKEKIFDAHVVEITHPCDERNDMWTSKRGEFKDPDGTDRIYREDYYFITHNEGYHNRPDLYWVQYKRTFPAGYRTTYKVSQQAYKVNTYKCSVCGETYTTKIYYGPSVGTVAKVQDDTLWYYSHEVMTEVKCDCLKCEGCRFRTDDTAEGQQIMQSHINKRHSNNATYSIDKGYVLAYKSSYYYTDANDKGYWPEKDYEYWYYDRNTISKYVPTSSSPIYKRYSEVLKIRQEYGSDWLKENFDLSYYY